MKNFLKNEEWENEIHLPVIECADMMYADQPLEVAVIVGKVLSHPNTSEHHIKWIQLYFQPNGDETAYQVGNFEFFAHGESVNGPNTGPVYVDHAVVMKLNLSKPGRIIAKSFCNVHGFWENSKEIRSSWRF